MGTLLPWQPSNCTITQPCKRMLSSYLAHVLFEIKHRTGLCGCYGNAVTMETGWLSSENFSGTKSIVLQISFVMLIFLLFLDQILGGEKPLREQTAWGCPCPHPVEESQTRGFTITQFNESILSLNLALVPLVVMGTLLPWQPENCAITPFERI